MAVSLTQFTPDQEPSWSDIASQKETIPAGVYRLSFVDAEERISKASGDVMVNVQFAIREGDYEGESIFQLYLLGHSKDSVRNRNMKNFGKLCVACGAPRARSTSELQGKEFMATISEKDDGEFGWKNEIKGYAPLEGIAALQAQEAQRSPTPQRPSVTTSTQADQQPQQKVAHDDLEFE